MKPKCPKCDAVVTTLVGRTIAIETSSARQVPGAALLCPGCSTIISVSLDPYYFAGLVADKAKGN